MRADIKITPYKCRTLYQEYKDIISRKKTVVDLIVKSDLMDLYRSFDNPSIPMSEAIHICMNSFVKVSSLYENTHEYFQSYLDGVGTINSCNEISRIAGKATCQEEILKEGLTSSHVLSYMFFSLVNNRKSRNILNPKDILEELRKERSSMTADSMEKSLGKLNTKIKEVTDLVSEMRNINMEFDVSDSLRTLESMKDKLDGMSNKQQEDFVGSQEKLNKLTNTLEETNTKVNMLSEHSGQVINRFGLIIDEIGNRLSRSNLQAEVALAKQKTQAMQSEKNAQATLDNIDRLQQTLTDMEGLFVESPPIEQLLDSVNHIQRFMNDLQGTARMQTLVTKEIDDKIRTIEEGVGIIKQVLDSLNTIMREDILINLARTHKGVGESARGLEAVGNKYKQIRNGGMFDEHIDQ